MRIRSTAALLMLTALIIAGGTSTTFADYTTVQGPASGELSHEQILEDIYGGNFTGSGTDLGYGLWTIFSNGTVSALRVNDLDGQEISLNIVTGGPDEVDQIWSNGATQVTAEAKYASYTQSFGWNGGGLGTSNYYELVTHDDIGNGPVEFELEGDFLWGMEPDGEQWWSMNSANSDLSDHMVTYQITGLESDWTVWLICMDDLAHASSDFDYNDFVVEVRAIPEPTTICLLGLGAIGLLRKRKNS